MPRNDAQQAAAQVAKQRRKLAEQKPGKGLAESVRKDAVEEQKRGVSHHSTTPRQMGGATDNMMRALFCPPQ